MMMVRPVDSGGVFRSDGDVREMVDGMIERLLGLGDGVTDWEREFCESVKVNFVGYGRLTDPQMAKLMEVFGRHFGVRPPFIG